MAIDKSNPYAICFDCKLQARCDKLTAALEKIVELDYANAATNRAATHAHVIAFNALTKSEATDEN
jgi:hypothetical protein